MLAATWKLYSVNGIKPSMVTDCSEVSDCCIILSGTEPTRVSLYVYPMMIPPRSPHGGSLQEKLRLRCITEVDIKSLGEAVGTEIIRKVFIYYKTVRSQR